jgi:hypothetical protein
MKKVLFVAVWIILYQISIAQSPAVTPNASPIIYLYDLQGKPLTEKKLDEVEGSPFLMEDWNWGAVKMKNGRYAKDVSLRFDLYNNRLFFMRDNVSFEFVLAVHEFMIGYLNGSDSQSVLYRNGYPAVDKNTSETFYEVLADGKIQLLNFKYKFLQEYRPYNEPPRKKFAEKEKLYILLPGDKIVEIKKDKDDILKAMPEYAAAITKIVDEKKLKLKRQEDIAQLVVALNEGK